MTSIRQGRHLSASDHTDLYAISPSVCHVTDDPWEFVHAMGATLYIPTSRPDISKDLLRAVGQGITSIVLDLEDAVTDREYQAAAQSLVSCLAERPEDLGIAIFVRPRHTVELERTLASLGPRGMPTGFVLPKADAAAVRKATAAVRAAEQKHGSRLWVMPTIETHPFVDPVRRVSALDELVDAMRAAGPSVLAVRLGASDLGGLLGVRRGRDVTVHDVHAVAGLIGDVVAALGCAGGWPITGTVWEHLGQARVLRPLLRATPFDSLEDPVTGNATRAQLLAANDDGLIREILLDRANGLTGKTVIHPEQAVVVNAMAVVPYDEYQDAVAILAAAADGGGVERSFSGAQMNEARPHLLWARRISARARACGVLRPERTFADALEISLHRSGLAASGSPHA